MFDYLNFVVNEERMKDLEREAENERLARSVAKNDDFVSNARRTLGKGLVAVGQQLLDEKRR